MFYVYVLYDETKFYIGYSEDLEQRTKDHKQGKVHKTKRYDVKKLELIYTEMFISEKDARRRERYLKTTKGRKGLKLILRETLE